MLLDVTCAGCDRPGAALCRTCRFALLAPAPPPDSHWEDGGVIVAVPFAGRVRDIVLALKYRNRRQLAGHLAGIVVNRVLGAGVRPGVDVDVVTWAPTSGRRRHRRGFDQGELVARRVARQLGLPCRRLLERDGPGAPQTGLSRRERLHGPVFRARPDARGRRVLVVDDVVTTGATLAAADRALRSVGVLRVVRAAVAATPVGVAHPGDRHGRVIQGPWREPVARDAKRRSA